MADVKLALQKLIAEATGDDHFFAGFQDDYRKRVISQKTVYLLQSRFGMGPKWRFNWYIAGPYSPALASELYALAEDALRIIKESATVRLSNVAAEKVGRLKALMALNNATTGLDMAQWLELLASIDYVSNQKGLALDSQHLAEQVAKAKPKFTEEQINRGIIALKERG